MAELSIFDTYRSRDFDVYFQEGVELDVKADVRYVKYGQDDIRKYVNDVAKPEIGEYATEQKSRIDSYTDGKLDAIADYTEAQKQVLVDGISSEVEAITTNLSDRLDDLGEDIGDAETSINARLDALADEVGTIVTTTANQTITGVKTFPNSDLLTSTTGVVAASSQTISGAKYFTGDLVKKSADLDIDNPPAVIVGNQLLFEDKNGVIYNFIQSAQFANGQVQFGLACRSGSNKSYTELGIYQRADGTGFAYCPPATETNSIVSTISRAVGSNYTRFELGNGLKVAAAYISGISGSSDYSWSYGITFTEQPTVVLTRRSTTSSTTVINVWVRGEAGTSSCSIYSNLGSGSTYNVYAIAIGH